MSEERNVIQFNGKMGPAFETPESENPGGLVCPAAEVGRLMAGYGVCRSILEGLADPGKEIVVRLRAPCVEEEVQSVIIQLGEDDLSAAREFIERAARSFIEPNLPGSLDPMTAPA